jgi:hypothetical protein
MPTNKKLEAMIRKVVREELRKPIPVKITIPRSIPLKWFDLPVSLLNPEK